MPIDINYLLYSGDEDFIEFQADGVVHRVMRNTPYPCSTFDADLAVKHVCSWGDRGGQLVRTEHIRKISVEESAELIMASKNGALVCPFSDVTGCQYRPTDIHDLNAHQARHIQ